MRFILLFLISLNAFGASIWPNGTRLETFQNGFLFGNGETIDATSSQIELSTGLEVLGPVGFEQQLTPSNPSAGFNKLYFKSDEKLYSLDSTGTEKPIGGAQVAGQEQTPADASLVEVPNNQATETDTNSFLLETGNNNLLTNPSFEHSTFDSGWTVTGTAVSAEELSVLVSGKKSFEVVATAQTFRLEQKSTLYASQIGDTQGLATIRIKNTNPLLKVCSISNDVDENCIDVESDNQWHLYEIPFLLGSTNSGIVVKAESSTGTAYIDDCYVGIIKPGMITETGAVGPWISYTPTFQGWGTVTNINFQYRVNGSSIEIRGRATAGTVDGNEVRIGLPTGFSSNAALIPSLQYAGGMLIRSVNAGQIMYTAIEGGVTYFVLTRSDGVAVSMNKIVGSNALSTGEAFSITASAPVAGLNSRVSLYSQQCRKPSDCENVFSANVSAAGVVSGENLDWLTTCSWSGSDVTCNFVSGIFTQAPNCWISDADAAGTATGDRVYLSSSTSFSASNTSGARASNVFCMKTGADYKERNMITGSFEGIEKCADPYECTDAFSAEIASDGTVVSENIDWINANCTNPSTGVRVCQIKSDLALVNKLTCSAMPVLQTGAIATTVRYESSSSPTQLEFISLNGSFTPVNERIMVVCQKQGVDFRPKTAVAGTFIDSVVSPGAGKPGLCSAKISSTGVISDQIGGCFASCTNATTPVCTFTSGYWSGTPNCWHSQASGSGFVTGDSITTSTTTSGQILNFSGAGVTGNRTYVCMGLKL
jgi:hypothetical protein